MRHFSIATLVLAVSLAACGNAASDANTVANGRSQTVTQMANPNAKADRPDEQAQAPKTGQYRLLGVLDPDFNNMVAFALKVPRGWQVNQSFKRTWDGAVPNAQIYVSFRSPDESQRTDYLPLNGYQYSDGPGPQSLRQQKRQMGMDPRMVPNELAPMPAPAYM